MTSTELPRVVSPEQWLAARQELLEWEKDLTRARDVLNRMRRALPAKLVERFYAFTGPDGSASLADLFEGRSQLIVAHLMYAPEWDGACPGCSMMADSIGDLAHLHARDTSLVAVSRAPYPRLAAYRKRMGWTFPWFSCAGTTFNSDFHLDPSNGFNYRDPAELKQSGLGSIAEADEVGGISVFRRDGADVLHTYSTYARGVDLLLGAYNWLDLTPSGRAEGWDGTPDLSGEGVAWVRRHDEYRRG
ncbi:MAG: DUF899 domain-containing protein [Sporichthyaceae bacterium]